MWYQKLQRQFSPFVPPQMKSSTRHPSTLLTLAFWSDQWKTSGNIWDTLVLVLQTADEWKYNNLIIRALYRRADCYSRTVRDSDPHVGESLGSWWTSSSSKHLATSRASLCRHICWPTSLTVCFASSVVHIFLISINLIRPSSLQVVWWTQTHLPPCLTKTAMLTWPVIIPGHLHNASFIRS